MTIVCTDSEAENIISLRTKEVDDFLQTSVAELEYSLTKFQSQLLNVKKAMIMLAEIKHKLINMPDTDDIAAQLADCVSDRRAAMQLAAGLQEEIDFLIKVIEFKTKIII